jgi:hypothetical protein
VVTVLRKAKRLSSKLRLQDINDWLDHEQSGYPRGDGVPEYRVVLGSICYNTNGYIPAGFGMARSGIAPLPGFDLGLNVPQVDPISGIMSHIASLGGGNGLYLPAGDDLSNHIRANLQSTDRSILDQLTFLVKLNESQVRDIPEQVKNKVLDWSCKLESAGVTGDGVSFSEKEKQIAQHVVFNIMNSTVDQITNGGMNLKGTADG